MNPTLLHILALDFVGVFCLVAAATTAVALLVDRAHALLTADVQASRRETEAELRGIRRVLDRVERTLDRVRDDLSSMRPELRSIGRSVAEQAATSTEPRLVVLIPATLTSSEPEADPVEAAPASQTPETAAEVDSTSPAPTEADFDFTALTSAHDPTLEAPLAPANAHGDHLPE